MKINLKQIKPFLFEIKKDEEMLVPARVYVGGDMIEQVKKDRSLWQLANVACLPGIQKNAIVMPDVHEGYGFPIGGVAAMDMEKGVISPGGIGYDINCGIRVLKTNFKYKEIKDKLNRLTKEIFKSVPSGVGQSGKIKLPHYDMERVLNYGCKWALKEGYADENDIKFIESNGSLISADADMVSEKAKKRGFAQIGTLGAGNHFIEIDLVQHIYDEEAAKAYGLYQGQIVIQIHTGSRGLGHQVATDNIRRMVSSTKKYGIEIRDRELSCVPISSIEGKEYFAAMSAAANYAWVNRQVISWEVRQAWKTIFGNSGGYLKLLYDVAHNIAKIENHTIDGKQRDVMVHRKGATRAFPAGHREVPKEYRKVGQPVLIPGSMGTASYILVGLPGSMEHSFGSACHGSGRLMSRTAARKFASGNDILSDLNHKGIKVQAGSLKGLSEEAPHAYKDVEMVVDIVEQAGIAGKVARLKPLSVIKG